MLTFGDAKDASRLVGIFSHVALYSADCDHPCPPPIAERWTPAQRRFITFNGDPECSIIDFEKYTRDFNDPAKLRDWLEERLRDKSAREPWIYSDLDNAASAARWARGLPFRWWLATLDGVRRSPGQCADLLIAWNVPQEYATPAMVAANQWRDYDNIYDESVCFVNQDW